MYQYTQVIRGTRYNIRIYIYTYIYVFIYIRIRILWKYIFDVKKYMYIDDVYKRVHYRLRKNIKIINYDVNFTNYVLHNNSIDTIGLTMHTLLVL